MVLFAPVSPNYKLIDFIYREGNDYNLFQSTISEENHSANKTHIVDVVKMIVSRTAPYLLQQLLVPMRKSKQWIEETDLTFNSMVNPKINLYSVVPHWKFVEFITTPTNPNKDAKEYCSMKSQSLLAYKWDEIVSIKVLSVNEPIVNETLISDP
jgi:hypothetical protein